MNKIAKFFKQTNTRIARKACSFAGLHPARLTKKSDLENLINKLRPVYCGYPLIRLGPKGDGGYLVPDAIEGITACFSPGVSSVSGFEKDCAQKGMDIFLADKSVNNPAEDHERFHFTQKFLGAYTNDDYMTLDHWVDVSLEDKHSDLLLQMDIEGFEYDVFFNVSSDLMKRFRVLVVEFHSLEQLWNEPFHDMIVRVFDKLLHTHTCVHNHPNNACRYYKKEGIVIPLATELTFIRNDYVKERTFVKEFPHPLDCINTTKRPALDLPECWYK